LTILQNHERLTGDVRRAYDNLANDPSTGTLFAFRTHLRCLDYFGVACKREETSDLLLSYYLFIGVVDSAIDSGHVEAGERFSPSCPAIAFP